MCWTELFHSQSFNASPICKSCNYVADTYHISAECIISLLAGKAISMFFNSKGLPASINRRKNLSQWLHLFGEISRLSFFINNEPRFQLFSHSIIFYYKLLVTITDCLQIQFGIGSFDQSSDFRGYYSHLIIIIYH